MNVKQLLIDTLEPFGFPVLLQGSLSADEKYPDSFFTFWNNSTEDDEFYDNDSNRVIWDFDLNFYSNDPELVNSKLLEAKRLLGDEGFIVSGSGYDIISDEPTHTGRGLNLIYLEKGENL